MDATMSRAARWYHAHKDDPAVKARLLEARRKSYQIHKEKEKAAALARYYRLKAEAAPAPGELGGATASQNHPPPGGWAGEAQS